MPSSAVRTFTDPDDYAAFISASKAEVTVTARGQFAAELTGIRLHQLWMQKFSENLPRILHSAVAPLSASAHAPDQTCSGAVRNYSQQKSYGTLMLKTPFSDHPGPLVLALCPCQWRRWFSRVKR